MNFVVNQYQKTQVWRRRQFWLNSSIPRFDLILNSRIFLFYLLCKIMLLLIQRFFEFSILFSCQFKHVNHSYRNKSVRFSFQKKNFTKYSSSESKILVFLSCERTTALPFVHDLNILRGVHKKWAWQWTRPLQSKI